MMMMLMMMMVMMMVAEFKSLTATQWRATCALNMRGAAWSAASFVSCGSEVPCYVLIIRCSRTSEVEPIPQRDPS